MIVRAQWDGDVATVTVHGEVDMLSAGVLRDCLTGVVEHSPVGLIVDLAGVEFLDSAGVTVLVQTYKKLTDGCRAVLRSPQPGPRRVLELTGLNTVWTVDPPDSPVVL